MAKRTIKSGGATTGNRGKPRRPAAKVAATNVLVVKVSLTYYDDIWRRIAVRGDQTLEDLHYAIFDAFERDEEHLYTFYFPLPGTRGRARQKTAVEFACTYLYENGDYAEDKPIHDAAEASLDSLCLRARQKFMYLFDFGDDWWHDIAVEQIDAAPAKGKYPRVLESHGKAPPQYPDLD